MIEPTDEMVEAYMDSEDADGPGVEWHSAAVRRHLAAVLAIVERDVLQPAVDRAEHAGHGRGWRDRGERDARRHDQLVGRGGSHPHYCVSCSEDGRASGPGCINCRMTGYDQTPWPDCEGCMP